MVRLSVERALEVHRKGTQHTASFDGSGHSKSKAETVLRQTEYRGFVSPHKSVTLIASPQL